MPEKKGETKYEKTIETMKEKLNEIGAKIKRAEEKTVATMSEHPVKTAGIAFGVGILAGIGICKLLERRKND